MGFSEIQKEEKQNADRIRKALQSKKDVVIMSEETTSSLLSFYHKSIHAHDIESMFSDREIIIRAGHLCAQNAIAKYDMKPIVRISLGISVDQKDMKQLLETIGDCL